MKKSLSFTYFIYLLIVTLISNCYIFISADLGLSLIFVLPFLYINIFAGIFELKSKSKRLKILNHGRTLLSVFIVSAFISVIYHIVLAFLTIPHNYVAFIISALVCVILQAIVFWNGIICVYATSVQLGAKLRVIGAVCGLIPIANLVILGRIIKTVSKEVIFEAEKEAVNKEREHLRVCETKYPILMVHGVFFRDTHFFNYWGRIPRELERNGAKIFYGNHHSAASISDCADELCERIKFICKREGCEKVNIIAHSKGGLDCRYAIENLGLAPYIASLTTINTPHRGCLFADYLLEKISPEFQNKVADTYNKALKKLGDSHPDFLAAVSNLTDSFLKKLDSEMPIPEGIYCQSVGSIMPRASGGSFPLNFSYHLVKYFSGDNDGLVDESSFKWGENYTLLVPKQNCGISHGDMIDLNRRNLDGFDVREFYVKLVSDLKDRGL